RRNKKKHLFDSRFISPLDFVAIKERTHFPDAVISDLLKISRKTYQTYKKPQSIINENVKERMAVIGQLFDHGSNLFGSTRLFIQWLNTPNFIFGGEPPFDYLDKTGGPQYIDDRLTGMEYGDNA
ncbi:MAG TPA: MbcA/ParS/Xre antitoxin family protein, partial [Bacteroidia bacterium]|nr:MbcA/ParS/Xre antitoxin family protein [Bacteroidia bacterium]